ncbi:MAG: ATP-binding protein [Bacteroidetes bacterium]|nr:ATP-binding protein [Bacteroidota bacterium]
MKRTELDELIRWKNSKDRKPLIIRGARQVGKTWLMKEFGSREYEQTVYINFEKNKRMSSLFDEDFDVKRILMGLQIEYGITISADNTLILFDEIQEAPAVLTSLKYFCEDAPEYHIIAAGSLLGVALHAGTSFPVGKVRFLDLYPLNYYEYLQALNENPLAELLRSGDWKMIYNFRAKYVNLLRQYYYIGGMPEAVLSFSNNPDFNTVRNIHYNILQAYQQDFSKHAPPEIVPRIRLLWNSVPAQLAKENKKFIYGLIKKGARAKDYESALSWLTDCGLVYKVCRASKPALPLIAYEDMSAFKLFVLDVGLLSTMGGIDVKSLIEGNRIFTEFKGALTEQYVLQQLISKRSYQINYWTAEKASAEIDFLLQSGGAVFPLEVKAEENLQAKSLKVFCEKYQSDLAVRTSMSDFRRTDRFINVPLYAVSELNDVINSVRS